MSNTINEWVATKTNSGHSIYSMFSGDTERPNKNYVELGDYEKLERELNEAKELIKNLNNLCYTQKAQEYLDRTEKGTE